MPATGPDFISLQSPQPRPTRKSSTSDTWVSSVRRPVPRTPSSSRPSRSRSPCATSSPAPTSRRVAQPGIGAAIWLHATDVQAIHDALVGDGHTIVSAPIDGPFGRTFTFADPDGYQITLHDRT